jgi:hypothetical protein
MSGPLSLPTHYLVGYSLFKASGVDLGFYAARSHSLRNRRDRLARDPLLGEIGSGMVRSGWAELSAAVVCVPRISSAALTSRVALEANRRDDHRSGACGSCSS